MPINPGGFKDQVQHGLMERCVWPLGRFGQCHRVSGQSHEAFPIFSLTANTLSRLIIPDFPELILPP